MTRKNAFTLIELLVVIAIIAILAAILFPVFAQAKAAAKATVILSNQKQVALAQQMYQNDTDDVLPSYITRTAIATQAHVWPRNDCLSWVQQFYPYIKNGLPTLTAAQLADPTTTEVPPTGVQFSSLWSEKAWVAAADQPDCDGAGALDSWSPVKFVHSHYGLSFPANNVGVDPDDFGPADPSAGTQANPVYYFAGSYLTHYTPSTIADNTPMNASTISRPAETASVTDGFTGVINGDGFGVTFGCESATMYKGGGNVGFQDSHVKFVHGNNQRYLTLGSDGKYFMTFFTVNR